MKGVVRYVPLPLSYYPRVTISSNRPISTATSFASLPAVSCIVNTIEKLPVEEFRREAFGPQEPRLITTSRSASVDTTTQSTIPAVRKWFLAKPGGGQVLNGKYLDQYKHVVLPYELVSHTTEASVEEQNFQRFHAPLDLFLNAYQSSTPPQLYIAQAQLSDLPVALRDDLPTPTVVLRAGKGDIYDANIWMGIPPTYTPLHKDPNPNLFLQLANTKQIRLFKPAIGAAIFAMVQEKTQSYTSATFRGDEMMQGLERRALEDAVWNCPEGTEGYEVIVKPGDALFIPKGWWHSIKSIGTDVTASVNWWFR